MSGQKDSTDEQIYFPIIFKNMPESFFIFYEQSEKILAK